MSILSWNKNIKMLVHCMKIYSLRILTMETVNKR